MPQSAWSTRHSPSWASWSLLQESLRKRKTQSIGPSPMSHSPTSFSLHCADFTVHGLSMSSLISLHTWGPSCRFHNQSSWIPWILSWLDLAQDPETTSRNQACLQSGRWRTNRGAIKQPSNDRETGEKMQSQDCSFSSWSSRIKVLKCAEQQPNGRFGRAILRIPLSCDTWFFSCCLVYPLLSFHALHQSKSIAGFTATHLKIAVVPALQVAVNAWVQDDVLHSPKAWKATRVDKTPRDLLQ